MRTSIALCTFNGARFLPEQLASLAAQTRRPDELVIVDDGSTDATRDAVETFAAAAPFPVRFHANPNRLGVTRNFQRAIEFCTGELIAPCDQDDVWLPEKLAALAGPIESDPAVTLAFCDLEVVDETLQSRGVTQWRSLGFAPGPRRAGSIANLAQLMRFNVVTGCAMMFRASLRDAILPIPEGYLHDEWIALIAAAVGELRGVDRPLVRYRQHSTQQVGQAVDTVRGRIRHARERMGPDYFARARLRAAALAERLESLGPRLRERSISEIAHRRTEHWRWRESLTSRVAPMRAIPVLAALCRGEYGRFGYGWRSAAQDLLLR